MMGSATVITCSWCKRT